MRKFLSSVLAIILVFNVVGVVVHAEQLVESGKSAVLIEVSTGRVLYELNMHDQLEPASMTKMMPMYLILEAIADGRFTWDKEITISEHAASLGGTQIYLEPGEVMSVKDLFSSVAIASANDSVTALAEALSGTEEAFVALMNERAKEFGMLNTTFKNPTGLPNDEHLTTAYDMAILGSRLIMDFPEVTEFTAMLEDYVREDSEEPFWLVNTNKLVRYVDGVDGLKTGSTDNAGYCLTATAKRGEMRVVAVVMGAPRSELRNKEVARLIEYAFTQYELHPRIAKGDVVATHSNILANGRTFDVVSNNGVNLLTGVNEEIAAEHYDIIINPEITMPIEPGEVIGYLVYYIDDEVYVEIELTVNEKVERTTILSLWFHVLGRLLFN